jgi:hypothetical protein
MTDLPIKISMMKRVCFFLMIVALALNGSAQLMKFKAEIPQTPLFKISDSIQSFTILNRSLTPEFQNFNEDSLQISFYKQNFSVNKLVLDSMVSDTTIKTLGDFLFNSERFDIVIPVERNIYRLLPFNQTTEPLGWNYVQSICDQFQTDALIVLEGVAMRTVTNYQTQKEFIDFIFEKTYYASIDFYSRAHWRIYDPRKKQIIVDYKMNEDTLFWDSYEYDLRTTFRNLPSIKEAATQTGIKIAADFGKIISPRWIEENRYYYVLNDSDIDESVRLASKGDWDSALQNWLKFVKSGNSVKRSKIMLNLALAYEMTGDLSSAINMAKESQKVYYREITNYYLKLLLKRISKTTKNP